MARSFYSVATLWSRAFSGEKAAVAELAALFALPTDAVEAAGSVARGASPRADVAAVVATIRARIARDGCDFAHEDDVARLVHLREGILSCYAELDDFAEAFARARPALLANRPKLDRLRGKARVLEEVRRDLLREPEADLPEELSALLEDAAAATTDSPPISFLEDDATPDASARSSESPPREATMTTTAAEVMTRSVLSVRDDLPIDELAVFFDDHHISGAPVITADGVPVGVVSLSDLARSSVVRSSLTEEPHAFYAGGVEAIVSEEEKRGFRVYGQSSTKVRDIMTPVVFSLDETSSVQEVAQAMLTGRIHRVFVTRAGKIVGIVSSMDLLPLVRDLR